LQVSAFKQWFANHHAPFGKATLGEYWLSHPQRRQYDGIDFAPAGTAIREGCYNLFQGFAVTPRKGD
jgi:hypothetical protein